MLVKFSPIVILLFRLNTSDSAASSASSPHHDLEATNMACSCRTAALQIFVRSLAQVHAPATQHVRSAWMATRPRLPTRNISVASNYRRAHSSAEPSDAVAHGTKEQQALQEDPHKSQPERDLSPYSLQSQAAGSSVEDERLFSIKLSSKNAIRKATRYGNQSDSLASPGSQKQAEKSPENDETSGRSADKKTEKKKKRAEKRAGREHERQAAKAKSREPSNDGRPAWSKQKQALKQKFPEGWRPPKRLSPDALEGIRVLHQQFPDMYTTEALAAKFEVSPEAIRRILKAKWEPTAEEEEDRQRRWFNRGVSVWQRYAELGRQPPRRWREAGVQASPWEGPPSREKGDGNEEDADKLDPETATRLQAQMKLSKSLV